jgi:hypothetical protein
MDYWRGSTWKRVRAGALPEGDWIAVCEHVSREALAKRVDVLAARVRPILAERSEALVVQHDRLVAVLRRILQRGEFLALQLAARYGTTGTTGNDRETTENERQE